MRDYVLFIQKNFVTLVHGLEGYVKEGHPFPLPLFYIFF